MCKDIRKLQRVCIHNEDAIIISEELVKSDTYTSIHIDEFDVEIRETKLGREEFTRDIPNVSEKALRNLNDSGIVQIGTYIRPGDILVGDDEGVVVIPRHLADEVALFLGEAESAFLLKS